MNLVIRPAQVTDSAAILALRNQQESVFWSGKPRISDADHAAWFPAHVQLILVLVDEVGVRGYGRVAEDGRVSFALDVVANMTGKGYGRQLLAALETFVPRRSLYALVHPSNVASMRAFMYAGYSLDGCLVQEKAVFQRVVKHVMA